MPKISAKLKRSYPNGGAKCGWGRLNAGGLAANGRFSRVVNLVRSQVYHIERPPDLFVACSPWCSASRGLVSGSWSLLLTVTNVQFYASPRLKRQLVSKTSRRQCPYFIGGLESWNHVSPPYFCYFWKKCHLESSNLSQWKLYVIVWLIVMTQSGGKSL